MSAAHICGEGVFCLLFLVLWRTSSLSFIFSTSLSLVGNSGHLTRAEAQEPQEQRYPFLSVRAAFSCVQTMVWLPGFGIFTCVTDVDACDCTQRLYGHRQRVCAGS